MGIPIPITFQTTKEPSSKYDRSYLYNCLIVGFVLFWSRNIPSAVAFSRNPTITTSTTTTINCPCGCTSLLASSSSSSSSSPYLQTSSSYTSISPLEQRLRHILEKEGEEENKKKLYSNSDSHHHQSLPIFDVLQSVRESLGNKPNLLLQAAPGAGKTTIVPLQILLDIILKDVEEKRQKGGKITENDDETYNMKQILVVEPRRVAVRSAAQRMSTLLGESNNVGGTVGYVMKDDVKYSRDTKIKVVTDGVLLNILRSDPELSNIDTVILDEFHERGVGSDTCLALLREVQQNFRDNTGELRIVVMSATLLSKGIEEQENDDNDDDDDNNATEDDNNTNTRDIKRSTGSKLMRTLGGSSKCAIVESEGRQHPIQIQWASQVVRIMSSSNKNDVVGGGGGGNRIPPLGSLLRNKKLLIETVSNVVEKAALKQAPSRGDILVFLPGVAECKGVVRKLTSISSVTNIADVFVLYGAMSKEEQDRVLFYSEQQQQSEKRRQRVIVSTPIAESSLTIPKVTCVVDCGLRREPRCDTDTGMPRLVSAKISQASSIQRSGRAGRVQEGLCLRLYTESDFENEFIGQTPAEIGKFLGISIFICVK